MAALGRGSRWWVSRQGHCYHRHHCCCVNYLMEANGSCQYFQASAVLGYLCYKIVGLAEPHVIVQTLHRYYRGSVPKRLPRRQVHT